jgi:succinoglycan biosynthesis protein ExoO
MSSNFNKKILVIVRQRIVGKTNGSSRYLLGILEYLQECGHEVRVVWPHPATFGRWPFLKLSEAVLQFKALKWRGGLRLGSVVFCTNPRVYFLCALAVLDRVLLKARLVKEPLTKPAPSALTAPVSEKEIAFASRQLSGVDCVLFDYVFSLHFAGSWINDVRSLVVMHDLFSKRGSDFSELGVMDSYGQISRTDEMRLLGRAGGVVAIQEEEAEIVRQALINSDVGVVPVGVEASNRIQPGRSDTVLFVGSNAGPNIVGIKWFLDHVWPLLQQHKPDLKLEIAGSCCDLLVSTPGVTLLGVVPDLSPIYDRAGVVISPLTLGSGLKIKLIEGLAAGKAMVVTSTTLQGVPQLTRLVRVADSPAEFCNEVLVLLENESLRESVGREALQHIRDHFSPRSAYGWIDRYVRG